MRVIKAPRYIFIILFIFSIYITIVTFYTLFLDMASRAKLDILSYLSKKNAERVLCIVLSMRD